MTAGDWVIRTAEQEFRAPDVETVRMWCNENRIPADAMVYRPGASVGVRADRMSEIRGFFLPKKVRFSERFWPAISNPREAKTAAMQGVWAAVIAAAITVVVVAFGNGILGTDAWSLVEVAFMLFFAFGTWRLWRWSAVCALALFVLGRISLFVEYPEHISGLGLLMTFVFLMMYVSAVRGTFAHRRFTRPKQAP